MSLRGLWPLVRVTPMVIGLYSITSVIAVLGTFGRSGPSVHSLLGVATAVTVVAAVVAVSVEPLLRRLGLRQSLAFLLTAALAGLMRGLALNQGLQVIGVDSQVPEWSRVLNSIVSVMVWMTIVALFDASREQYRRRYAALMLQAMQATAALDSGLDEHPDVVRLKRTITQALEGDSQATMPTADIESARIAAALRLEIESSLRPLSHRIWFSAQEEEPRARVGQLIRDALEGLTVPIASVVGVWFLGGLGGAASLFGFARGMASVVISTGILLLCLWGARMVVRRRRALQGAILLVLCSVLPIVATDQLLKWLGYATVLSTPIVIFLIVALATLILGGAAIALAAADRRVILSFVESRVNAFATNAREGLRGAPTELSSFLHNSLQAELHGLALQLDSASRLGDAAQARAALERLGALANRSLSEDFRSFRESPRLRLDRISEAWSGIADLGIHVSDAIEATDPRLAIAVRATEELIANAVRHGGATQVAVRFEMTDEGDLAVDLESDGVLVMGSPGMGEGWLSAVSQSPVVMSGTARGSAVHLVI